MVGIAVGVAVGGAVLLALLVGLLLWWRARRTSVYASGTAKGSSGDSGPDSLALATIHVLSDGSVKGARPASWDDADLDPDSPALLLAGPPGSRAGPGSMVARGGSGQASSATARVSTKEVAQLSGLMPGVSVAPRRAV